MIFKEVEIDRRVGLVVYNLNGRKHRLKGVIGGGTNRSSIGSKFWCRIIS